MAKRAAATAAKAAPAAAAAPAAERGQRKAAKRVRVRATQDGYYANKFRRTGDVFSIDGSTAAEVAKIVGIKVKGDPDRLGYFSEKWMELADANEPEHTSSPNEVLQRKRAESRQAQAQGQVPGGGPATGDADPLGDD